MNIHKSKIKQKVKEKTIPFQTTKNAAKHIENVKEIEFELVGFELVAV